MKIATWNVNGMRARLEFVLLWLKERQPDVVGLQELKLEESKFPYDAFAEIGYSAVVHGQKSWNGVATLSRDEPAAVQCGLPGQEDFGARLVTADIGDVRVSSLYCPNGKTLEHDDFTRKLGWFDDLIAHLRSSRTDRPWIVGGDFNICPAPIDSWSGDAFNGQIFHTTDERRRFQAVLDSGFRDTFRDAHPEARAFSWWDYRGGAFHRKHGLRIDFLLANAAAAERVREVSIDRDFRKKQQGLTPSDHAPVVLELDV